MRVRIQTALPLPDLKAWYAPNEDQSSIAHLKDALFLHIPVLEASLFHSHQVVLLLDGFELLDDSPLDVVRDGDLVIVKLLPDTQPSGSRKRKAARGGE
jgi:hypothetical protein